MANLVRQLPCQRFSLVKPTVISFIMAILMSPFALTLSVSRYNEFQVHFTKTNGLVNVEPSLEETLAMEVIGTAANFVQIFSAAANVLHGGNNVFHSMRRFRKEHEYLTDEVMRAIEQLQELENLVRMFPTPRRNTPEGCIDCGLQSAKTPQTDPSKLSLLEQLSREFPSYRSRLSKIERVLVKSTPKAGQPVRTIVRQFGWHFKKQVLYDLLFALERRKTSFMVIIEVATLQRYQSFLVPFLME
jgi:hypothetical protein